MEGNANSAAAVRNPTSIADDRFGYSIAEVARGHGLSIGFVRLEISRGRLRAAHLGRRVVITRQALADWLGEAI